MRTAKAFFTAAISAAAVLTAAHGASAATNILINGSFEDVGNAAYQSWGGYTFGPDFAYLPGWTIDFGNVDITTNLSGWSPAADGNNSLDINGWVAGQISQSFNTVVGQTYTVSFAYSRNAAGAPDPATADVSAGGQVIHVTSPNDPSLFGTVGSMLWQTGSFTFVGTGYDTLVLTSTVPGNGGVYFDDFVVSGPAVPEPTTWTLMILGFGGAGALGLWREAVHSRLARRTNARAQTPRASHPPRSILRPSSETATLNCSRFKYWRRSG